MCAARAGADRPCRRYRATRSGQSKVRPLYVTRAGAGPISAVTASRNAASSPWSGRRSWTRLSRPASHRAIPTRNATVPVPVPSPVVSVSRQTNGRSGPGWPGIHASRSRSSGRASAPASTRTTRPAGVETTVPPVAAARRAARGSARTACADATSRASGRSWSARNVASRRPRVTPETVSATRSARPVAPASAPRPIAASVSAAGSAGSCVRVTRPPDLAAASRPARPAIGEGAARAPAGRPRPTRARGAVPYRRDTLSRMRIRR